MMVIVHPTIDDLAEIIATSKVWHNAMDFDRIGKHFDEDVVTALWRESLLSPFHYDVLVARQKNIIIGAFGVVYKTTHTWFRGVLQGYELVYHADPRLPVFTQGKVLRGLYDAMLPLIAARDPEVVYIGCDARYPGVTEMLIRQGAEPVTNTVMLKRGTSWPT